MKKLRIIFGVWVLGFLALGAIRIVPPWLTASRVTHDASPRWIIVTPDQLPINTLETNLAPWIDGYMIRVDSADSSPGQVAVDTTVCTVAPCTQTSSWTTLDTDVKAFAALTCAVSLRPGSGGHPCYINFTLRGMSNPNSNYNINTPQFVYGQPWATTVGSALQHAAYCSPGYPLNTGSLSGADLPPATGTAFLGSLVCGAGGTTACSMLAASAGVPAYWELPFFTFKENYLYQFLTYLSTASYLSQVKYVSLGMGTGDENTITCATIAGAGSTGLEFLGSVPGNSDAGLKQVFVTHTPGHDAAIEKYDLFAVNTRHALGLDSIVLLSRFNMGGSLSAGASTDPSWAISEVQTITQYPNVGIGSNGWKNGSNAAGGSDLLNIVGASVNCVGAVNSPPCTSNNWSNAMPAGYGKAVYIVAQESNISDPAGGTVHILDASLSGTGAQADTLWQWFTLAGAAGVNVIEMGPKEAACIGNVTPSSPCVGGNAIQLAYQGAALAWARGSIPINH